jgi:hypothetical protein
VRWKQTVINKKYWNIIWGLHSSDYSGWGLLDHGATQSYTWMLMFWMNMQPPLSGSTLNVGANMSRVLLFTHKTSIWRNTHDINSIKDNVTNLPTHALFSIKN